MPDINIKVEGKQATLAEEAFIVCGNSDYKVLFSFDDEWAQHITKTARFVWRSSGVLKYTDTLFTGNSCPVPVLSGAREVRIGVYSGNLQTTTAACVHCKPSIRCGAQKHAAPTPDVYDQIIELVETSFGELDEALDHILAIQENLIGGAEA